MKQLNTTLRMAEQGNEGGQGGGGGNAAPNTETQLITPTIGSFLNPTNNRPSIGGLVLMRKRNDPTALTGVGIMKKKDFKAVIKRVSTLPKGQVDLESGMPGLGLNEPLSDKAAERAFSDYRRKTVREFTEQQAHEMLAGRVSLDSVRVGADGKARQFTIVRDADAKKDKAHDAIEQLAITLGIPPAATEKFIADFTARQAQNPTVDIPSTPVVEGGAQPGTAAGQPAIDVQTTEVRQPQNVAAQ